MDINTIPAFKFGRRSPDVSLHEKGYEKGYIEVGNENNYRIANIDTFYCMLGYTVEVAKKRILPDEFIWDTFLKHTHLNCYSCYQLRIIQDLLKHEPSFLMKFGQQCDEWISVHFEKRNACKISDCSDKKPNLCVSNLSCTVSAFRDHPQRNTIQHECGVM